jgi:hypothetical protein
MLQWPKDKRYNGQKTNDTMTNRQAIQWPKEKRNNGQKTSDTMTKRKTTE